MAYVYGSTRPPLNALSAAKEKAQEDAQTIASLRHQIKSLRSALRKRRYATRKPLMCKADLPPHVYEQQLQSAYAKACAMNPDRHELGAKRLQAAVAEIFPSRHL